MSFVEFTKEQEQRLRDVNPLAEEIIAQNKATAKNIKNRNRNKFGKIIGGVIGNSIKVVASFINEVRRKVGNLAQRIVDFFRQAFEKIVSFIPEPLKRLLGGLELPEIDLNIKGIEETGKNFLKDAQKNLDKLKDGVIEFSGVEKKITDENNKQLDAKNKIVITNNQLNTSLDKTNNKTKEVSDTSNELTEKFIQIGQDIEKGIVNNLTDAVMGTKTLAEAATNVLNNLKRKLIEVAIQSAVSGIGGKISGFLGGLFGRRERGGPVSAGGAYLVGEKGPEILQMGSRSGNIIPNNKLGGGVTNNYVTVNVESGGATASGNNADLNALGQLIATAVQAQLARESRAGGLLRR